MNIKHIMDEWIQERIKTSEGYLKDNDTDYESVLKNEDTGGYGEQGENNNFEAGIISGLKEFQEKFLK